MLFKKPTKKALRFYLVLTFLLSVLALVFIAKFFTVKNIKITVNDPCINQNEIINSLNLKNKSIIFLNKEIPIKKIKDKNLCIKEIKVQRIFPSTILVNVTTKKPSLLIQLVEPSAFNKAASLRQVYESSPSSRAIEATSGAALIQTLDFSINSVTDSSQFIADQDGFLFATATSVDVPKVYGDFADLQLGKTIDKRIIVDTTGIFEELKRLNISIETAKIIKGLYLVVNSKYVFLLDGDILREAASLQLILQKNKIDLKTIDSIDLRFSKPISLYSNKR